MLVDLISSLPTDQFKVTFAVFSSGGTLEEGLHDQGVVIEDLNKSQGFDISLPFKLRRILKKYEVDVIHTNNFVSWLYAVLSCFLVFQKITIVHTEHSLVDGGKKRRYILEKILALFTDHLIAVSQSVKNALVRTCNIDPVKVEVIENGVNTEKFKPADDTCAAVRSSLGISDDSIVIGTVGRLVPVKDHATLIRSVNELVNDGSNICLILVGDGSERSALEALAEELKINENVHFLGEQKQIGRLLCSFDIYAVSSISEGMSISLLEAMSTGLPVVATRVVGNVDLIEEGTNGVFAQVSNPEDLARATEVLIRDAKLRKRLGENNRKKIETQFSQKRTLTRYIELYES